MGCGSSTEKRVIHGLTLPQEVSGAAREERKKAVEEQVKLFPVVQEEGMATHFDGVPKPEDNDATSAWGNLQTKDIVMGNIKVNVNQAKEGVKEVIDAINPFGKGERGDPFERFGKDIYPEGEFPPVADRWLEDKEFARQRLEGCLPMLIKKFDAVPAKFPVTDALMEGIFPAGQTIQSMIAANRLYWCDQEILAKLNPRSHQRVYAPMLLLYVNDEKVLMPAAIQLKQDPKEAPIFVPKGDDLKTNRWLVARIIYNSNEAITHEGYYHVGKLHYTSEAIYAALKRNVSQQHPLSTLIGAHFFYTANINHIARTTLSERDSGFCKVLACGYEGWGEILKLAWADLDYTSLYNLPQNIQQRGIQDLPNFHWRDDLSQLWTMIHTYVSSVLKEFYRDNGCITGDEELQAWVNDVVSVMNVRGTPFKNGKCESVTQLIDMCAMIIFSVSGYHATINNAQYQMFGYVPNVPGVFGLEAPSATDEFSLEQIADAMPSSNLAAYQIGFIHVAGLQTDQEFTHFTHFGSEYMCGETECMAHFDTLKKEVERLQKHIDERNAKLEIPYIFVSPRQIANSIAL